MPILDKDIRQALVGRLNSEHSAESDTLIIPELTVCDGIARVDIAVLNGTISGFEIKSERDSLTRLSTQVPTYARCFDSLTLVAPAKHLNQAREILPRWWGLMEVGPERAGCWELKTWRRPKPNTGVDATSVVGLLWKTEILAILKRNGLSKGLAAKPLGVARDRLVKSMSATQLREEIRSALKARGDWRSGSTPFRSGDSCQSSAMSLHSQEYRSWLLSLEFQRPHR